LTRNQSTTFLMMLFRAFPGYASKVEDKKAFLDIWSVYLEPYDFETVKKAGEIYVRNNKYFPTVEEFIKTIEQGTVTITITPEHEFRFENSGCTVCPYLEENQTSPCPNCVFEEDI